MKDFVERFSRHIRPAMGTALALILLALVYPGAAAEQRISVAVLPFTNLSGDANEAFADGFTEDLAATLAKIPALNVGARASAFRFKAPIRDRKAIGQALAKTHLVEGTFRTDSGRIRVLVRLIRADDGEQLWYEDYDEALPGIFNIEEAIAKAVAGALRVPLPAGEPLVRNRTTNMDAYEKYLRAKPLIRARGQKPFADAAVLLEQAVVSDPKFAPALALLAFDYDLAPLYQQALRSGVASEARAFVDNVVPKAEILARRSTQLDGKRVEGFVALAYAEMVQRKLLQADELFRQALALDANNTDALHGYSQLLAAEGRINESLAMRNKLQALEPFVINYVADTAEIFWLDGDNDTAIRMLNEFRPGRTAELAQVHASLGHYHEAASVLREMNAANYSPGLLESAARLIDSAPAKTAATESQPPQGSLGFVYLHVGAPERVLEYYESNNEAGYFQPISTTWFWHPSYAPVRKLERFKAFARAIGLIDVWRARGWPDLCKPVGADDFACN
jgi:adenylate cyclase